MSLFWDRPDSKRCGGFGMLKTVGIAFQINFSFDSTFMNCELSEWSEHKRYFACKYDKFFPTMMIKISSSAVYQPLSAPEHNIGSLPVHNQVYLTFLSCKFSYILFQYSFRYSQHGYIEYQCKYKCEAVMWSSGTSAVQVHVGVAIMLKDYHIPICHMRLMDSHNRPIAQYYWKIT